MNSNMLKGKMRECSLTQQEVAEKIGVSLSRFNAKLNGTKGAEFSLGEAQALRRLLGLTADQMEEIFLQ